MPADHGADPVAQLVRGAERARPRCGDIVVVAMDGPSGSGKTALAARLQERTGAPVLHMDDIYPGWDGLSQAVSLLSTQVLEPLAHGERAAYRRWDWEEDRWDETVDVPPSPLLVVEGCGSSVGTASQYAAVRVWVQAPRAVRFARGMERDGEAYRPHWERWARQEDALFAADRTRERADIVIDTTGWC